MLINYLIHLDRSTDHVLGQTIVMCNSFFTYPTQKFSSQWRITSFQLLSG